MNGSQWNWARAGALTAAMFWAGATNSVAQEHLEPARLPKSTMFYVAWHGAPAGEARKANSLLALWDDPDFAPVRAAMIEGMVRDSKNAGNGDASKGDTKAGDGKKGGPKLTREEIADVASLLDNEFVVGYLSDPNPAAKAKASAGPAHKWEGTFFVYDRTGKEKTLANLLLRTRLERSNEKDAPQLSTMSIAGIPVMKLERKTGTTYLSESGKYLYTASEPAVFEQIVAWSKHQTPEAGSLGATAAYQEAAPLLEGGVVDFFLHLPGIKEFPTDVSPGGFRLGPMLQNLRLDAIHAIAGHLVMEGPRMRVQGAILGDTSKGTPFDLWGDGVAAPVSLQFVNEKTVSYQCSQINLLGIYGIVKRALQTSSANGQQGPMDFVESAAKTKFGMPLADALGLFTGEFAGVQTGTSFDANKSVYVVGIQKKPEVLKLLRLGLGERLANERNEGTTTFLKISEGGIQNTAGTAAWKYYHVAVTPDAIVGGSRYESVREALASRKNAAAAEIALPQAWQIARTNFPKALVGMSFVDFQKIDWSALKERWKQEATAGSAAGAKNAGKTDSVKTTQPSAFGETLANLDPAVLQRHLHLAANASWKDAHGMHLDGWVE
jgi:hypothetical protein